MSISLRVWVGDLELTDYPYMLGFGMDLGRPENVYTVLNDLLADGEPVTSNRTSNRSMTLPVAIEGPDMQSLADAEAALLAECEKANSTLKVDPGDGFGPPTVFDTFRVQVTQLRNDDEEQAFFRRYSLEVQALPAARSELETVASSDSVSSTVVVADECESTTGWSNLVSTGTFARSATFSVDSTAGNFVSGTGSIKLSPTAVAFYSNGIAQISYRGKKSGLSINASGGGYVVAWLRMEWPTGGGVNSFILKAFMTTSGGGVQEVTGIAIEAGANGFLKYAFLVPNNSTVTALDLDVVQQRAAPVGPVGSPALWVDAIGFAASAAGVQQLRSFDVGGSMRSEGSFEIAATAGLGDVLLYTCPDLGDGFRPDLRRYQATGTSTADATAVNGTYTLSTGSPTFEAPAAIFRPGAYGVLIHGRASTSGVSVVTVTAVTRLSSTDLGQTQTIAQSFTLPDQSFYYATRIGVLDLPPNIVDPASGAKVKFTISATGAPVKVAELLVFPLEESALTWVRCGEGSPSVATTTRLWLDAPSPLNPRGSLVVGNAAGRADARGVVPMSRGRHMLTPGRMLAYLLASGSSGGPSLSARYFKKWHTNAAD